MLSLPENRSCDHSAGLWQDWQERCHWEDLGGKQVHRGRAETLVRHACQPPPPYRPVASTAARRGGGCRPRSPECQEVNTSSPTSTLATHAFPILSPGPTYQCIFQKNTPTVHLLPFKKKKHPTPSSSPAATFQKIHRYHSTWWEI